MAQVQQSFASILDMQPSEVERPKPLPAGTYLCVVDGRFTLDKSTRKQTDYVEFTLKILQAMDDVDADDLQAALTKPTGEVVSLNSKTVRVTYYLTPDALWRLKKFLEDCGIDLEGRSFAECLEETPGCQVLAEIKHQVSANGEAVYANVTNTARPK
jgi:hypothetical protein